MTDHEYEANEARSFHKQLADVEKAPLSDRKESAERFLEAMRDPELVAERINWLLAGNYGYGAMQAAKRILHLGKRANKSAHLTHMIGALEWQCPARLASAAWKKMSTAEKAALNAAVKKEL